MRAMPTEPTKKPSFDPDFSPEHRINREAARSRGLTYDPVRQVFVDVEGLLILDKFGQPL